MEHRGKSVTDIVKVPQTLNWWSTNPGGKEIKKKLFGVFLFS